MKNIRLHFALLLVLCLFSNLKVKAQCNPDITPPVPICFNGLNVGFENGTTELVWASDFNFGSFDNCTSEGNLVFSFDAAGTVLNKTYTSLGTYQETMVVTDEAGNQDSCILLVEVTDCIQAMACVGQLFVSLDTGEFVDYHIDDILQGGPYCASSVFSFSDTSANDTIYRVNWDDPTPLTVSVYDLTTSNTCWTRVINCSRDTVPPVAISNVYTTVNLDATGKAILHATTVDDGSFDMCGGLTYELKRYYGPGDCEVPGPEYKESLVFCCRDIGDTIKVELRVTDLAGNTNVVVSDVIVRNLLMTTNDCARVYGRVYLDVNDNCQYETSETVADQVEIVITNGVETYTTLTDNEGYYYAFISYGVYDVYANGPGGYWNSCPGAVVATLTVLDDDERIDFGLTSAIDCPLMSVELSSARLRRCFENVVVIDYINRGSITAVDAEIVVELDDHLDIITSTHTYTSLGNGEYQFPLGDVDSYERGEIRLTVTPNCDSTAIGETKCMGARIYPDTVCFTLLPWSGAEVAATGECREDSVVFNLTNTGTADMALERMYTIIEDDVVLFMRSYKLDQGAATRVAIEATGATYRIIAEQELNHPFNEIATVAFEGCQPVGGGPVSTGFVTQFAYGDGEPFYDLECHELIGSYDPNEKTASPVGYGSQHYIEPGTSISYTLYFQNTGNDTAFNVYLLDTLSEDLDLRTIVPGPSSHAYTFDYLEDHTIRFSFDNIMLPDSFVNEPASNGFVKFTIEPKEGLELPTVIENSVAIYFDFNDPVITNTVFHTIDTGFYNLITFVKEDGRSGSDITFSPNPALNSTIMTIKGQHVEKGRVVMTGLDGRQVMNQEFYGNHHKMDVSDFTPGIYIYQVFDGSTKISSGKVMVSKK